ncbi:MAG: hypothetical protein ACRC51_04035 [Cetobacterium sp.]
MATIDNSKSIDYSYTSGSEEHVLLRGKMILLTPRGSLPLDRELGYDPKLVDRPLNIILPALKVDLTQQFKRYVPELVLKDVYIESVSEGKVYIKCEVEVNNV